MKSFLKICLVLCTAGSMLCISCGKRSNEKTQSESVKQTGSAAVPASAAASAKTPSAQPAPKVVPPVPKILPGLENGLLKIPSAPPEGMEEEAAPEKAKVEDSGKNIRIVEKNSPDESVILHGGGQKTDRKQKWEKATLVPANSLAAQLTPAASSKTSGKGISWAPTRVSAGIGRAVRLPDLQLSHDQSLFVFAETTGKPEGPFGTRLILMNAHSWQIIRIVNAERRIEKFAFIPGTAQIAAICTRQSALEQPYGLAVIDLASGKETGFRMLKDPVCSFLVDRSKTIWLTDGKNQCMTGFSALELNKEPVSTPLSSVNAALALSPDGKKIAAACLDGKVAVFAVNRTRPLATVKSPVGLPVNQLLFVDNEKTFLAAPDPLENKPAFILRNGQIYDFEGRSSGLNQISGDGARLFIGQKVKGKIDVVNAVSQEKLLTLEPAALRPLTDGSNPAKFFLLDNLDAFAILDQTGNFYLVFQPDGTKKYQKEIIFTPQD